MTKRNDEAHSNPPSEVVFETDEERMVWANFYASIACGHFSNDSDEEVDLEAAAIDADAMLLHYRVRHARKDEAEKQRKRAKP